VIFTEGGLLGLTRKNAFTFGSRSLSSSFFEYCQPFSTVGFEIHHIELIVVQRGISMYGVKIGMPSAIVSPALIR
jgi:hypothetical protein